MLVPFFVPSALAVATSCGPKPHDASVAAHEQAASAEDERAQAHLEDYEGEGKGYEPNLCMDDPNHPPCWTPLQRKAEHLRQVDFHRKAAAAHREAARALVDAEALACDGLSGDERDISPFFHVPDIESVELDDQTATVVFRPVANLTQARLRQHVECHLARNASLGHEVPEMDYCLLVPRDVTANVASSASGLSVVVSAQSRSAARELEQRTGALRQRISQTGQ